MDEEELSIPREVKEFFEKPGGRSLIIKGAAGTGKTTFALQTLEEISDPENSFYLSTRVSDESLYVHFPWLKDKETRIRILDASREFLSALYKREKKVERKDDEKVKGAREFLKAIQKVPTPTSVERKHLEKLLENYDLHEIESIYDRVEQKLPNETLLVIDSVEGVTQKYKIDAEDLVNALQKDLVEGSNVNLLMVLEKDQDIAIDFLVDGVILMVKYEIDGRRVREIRLEKLRSVMIKQPRYLTTLLNGRFKSFEPFSPVPTPKKWEIVSDSEEYYSTGTEDLDALLGGGFKKGSYNVIEVGENVSNEEYYALVRPIILNFISQKRGAIVVLTGGDHADALRRDLNQFVDEEIFDNYVTVADYFIQESKKPYVLALGTRNKEEALRNWRNVLMRLRGKENKPIMDFAGFDTLEYLRGNEIAIRDLFNTVGAIKISKDLGIGILKPGLRLKQEIMNMADTYIKIIDINKSCCMYGIKPPTIIHVITPDKDRGFPHVKLIPIV